MGKMLSLLALLTVCSQASTATGSTEAWIPGSPYYVTEGDADSFYEDVYDFVYCQGIARFGKRGEFPDEEYLRFECDMHDRRYGYCTYRTRSFKATRSGYFRMKIVRGTMDC